MAFVFLGRNGADYFTSRIYCFAGSWFKATETGANRDFLHDNRSIYIGLMEFIIDPPQFLLDFLL